MISNFRAWWKTRSMREQRLLLIAGGLAVVVLSWLLIIRPVNLALASAKENHDRAVIERAQVVSLVEAVAVAQQSSRPQQQGAIRDIVSAEAARIGFDVTQTEAAGPGAVRVIIGAVRPQTFFGWVSDLELRLGLDIEALTVRPNADETLAVDVTFRGAR